MFALVSTVAVGQQANISPDLQHVDPNTRVNVIVQFKHSPSALHHHAVANLGGSLHREFQHVKAGAYSVPAASLAALAADPEVAFVSLDRKVHLLLDNTTAAVNAPAAWNLGLDGSGIGVAVIDSGITEHDDLQGSSGSRIVFRDSLIGGDTQDHYGHGEHVAGIIGGNGADSKCSNCSRNLTGVAPNVSLIDLQVLDGNGDGSDSTVIAGIEEAIQLQSQFNIRVINLSLGRPIYESYKQDPLCQAVEAAWQAGIVVVVAAGNGGRDNSTGNMGYGTILAPANDPYVITVGATRSMGTPDRADDLVASYSSKGPTAIDHIVKPDLIAPGNLVVSLESSTGVIQNLDPQGVVPLSYYQWTSSTAPSTSYFTLSGTSMAAPVVSGAAALLLQANPQLTPDQVKAKLMLTAYKTFPTTSTGTDPATGISYLSQYDLFTIGAGYLDIKAALADNTPFWSTALSPTAVYTPIPGSILGTATVSCGFSSVCKGFWKWSTQSLWGTQSINSDQTIWGNYFWGTMFIWANDSPLPDPSTWPDQSYWPDQSLWPDLNICDF